MNYCDILGAGASVPLQQFFNGLDQFLGIFFCSTSPMTVSGFEGFWDETFEATYENQKEAMTDQREQNQANRAQAASSCRAQLGEASRNVQRGTTVRAGLILQFC